MRIRKRLVAFQSVQPPFRLGLRLFREIWRLITHDVRNFIHRGLYGYATSDLWSLDWYLLTWLPSALRHFNENRVGYPGGMTDKEWSTILEKMADKIENMYTALDESTSNDIDKGGMEMLVEHFWGLWD